MAAYYALLAKAVAALPRNDEASRREIYVKARSALIRQLKAITPPLPPAEISKQRLALEEAIRKVEREAVEAAAATMLSEEEIARRAEQALEEALSPSAMAEPPRFDDLGRAPAAGEAVVELEPEAEPVAPRRPETAPRGPEPMPPPRGVTPRSFHPNARPPEPEMMSPRAAPPPRAASPQPAAPAEAVAEVVRPGPAERKAARPPAWERASTVTDVEATPAPARAGRERTPDPRRGGRGWERAPRRARQRRSLAARLIILVLILVVVGAGGYFAYQNWDTVRDAVTDFIASITGAPTEEVVEEPPAEVVVAEGEGTPAAEAAAPVEPPVFVEAQAYLYEEPLPTSPEAPKHAGTIVWTLIEDATRGAVVRANIAIPDQGVSIIIEFWESADPAYSHEITALVQQAAGATDPLRAVETLSIKTAEEAIGVGLQGDVVAPAPDAFLLALPARDGVLNLNRINTSPWFDLALVFESDRRAIVAFSKGTTGSDVFAQAMAAWAAN